MFEGMFKKHFYFLQIGPYIKIVNTDSYLFMDSKKLFLYYLLGTFLDAGDIILNQGDPVEV